MTNKNLIKQVSIEGFFILTMIILMLGPILMISMLYRTEKQQMTQFLEIKHGCEIKVLAFDIDTFATYEWATDESKVYKMFYTLPDESLKRRCIGCYNVKEKKYTHMQMDDKPWNYPIDMDKMDESQTKHGRPDND